MKMPKNVFVLILGLVLLTGAFAGGRQPAGSSGEAFAPNNDLVVGMFNDIQHLDIHASMQTVTNTTLYTMYECLVDTDMENKIIPWLALSWTVAPDNRSYTFNLRRGVKFHDGTDFNAAAFVANYRRGMENTALRLHSRITTWDSVTAVDNYTLMIRLKEPDNTFLYQLAAIGVVSPKAIAEQDLQRYTCGTGPYVFKERVDGDHVTVVPNQNYWGEKPTVNSLTFKAILEDGSRIAAIQTGECDMIYRVPAAQASVINGTDNIEIISKPSTVMRYVTLNTRLPQLSDKRVRQALNYAIDKNAYIRTVFQGYGVEVRSIYPPTQPFYKEQPAYAFDLNRARSLLAAAGYPNGFEINIWGDTTSTEQIAMQFVQQQLAQIGVRLNVMPMDPNVINSLIYVPDDQMTIHTWYVNWSSNSPDGAVRNILSYPMRPPTSANTAYYNNPRFDELLNLGRATIDPARQAEIYAELQAVAWEDAPWLFMGSDNVIAAKKTYLTGVELYPGGGLRFPRASLRLR